MEKSTPQHLTDLIGPLARITTGGYSVTPLEAEALLAVCQRRIKPNDWVVCAGSLPAGMPTDFYRTVTSLTHQARAKIIVDCQGESILQALEMKPDIVKMNRSVLSQTFSLATKSFTELKSQLQSLHDREGLPSLVITCGEEGILAITPQGNYLATAPRQEVVNATGAGYAISAALA